jgi:uncharacterized membrane protein
MPYVPYYKRQAGTPKHDRFDKLSLGVAMVGGAVLAVTAGIMLWQTIEISGPFTSLRASRP